jgi:hypothetical protein
LAPKPGQEVLHFDFVFYGRLLDENSHRCEPLTDFSHPGVLSQGRKRGCDCFIKGFCCDLYGVLNVVHILHGNYAGPENHAQERITFVFCSPYVGNGLILDYLLLY